MRRARAADVSPAVARGMMVSTIRHAAAKMATTYSNSRRSEMLAVVFVGFAH